MKIILTKTFRLAKPAALASISAVLLGGMLLVSRTTRADDGDHDNESRIREGFAIAPVPLNLAGRNRELVGLGSYYVNAVGDCNGCHTSDQPNPYLPGGNPFMGQRERLDPAKYLVGGTNFFANVTSRNLRPEKNGLPAGRTFSEFLLIIRTGLDLDHAHPQFGPLLQVMPWPAFRNMSDGDIRAIYEYLSALPPNPVPQP